MVGFVGVQQASKVRKADVQHTLLAEKATAVFEVSPAAHPACSCAAGHLPCTHTQQVATALTEHLSVCASAGHQRQAAAQPR